MKKGLLIVLSGPSGVGKGTVRRQIFKDKSLNLAYSISMTTRPPRAKEIEGVDYFFVSKEEFLKGIEEDKFLEHATFVGNYYGTPKDYVENLRKKGKNVFLEIEVEGAKQVLSKYKDDDGVVSIFLLPPSLDELEKRIRGRRSEEEEIIQERLNKAKREINLKSNYQYNVLNDNIYRASDEIRDIIKAKLNSR
ncbi:MAG: guanylate kinase [Bacilli bacterium]|nr:guanylate kinase [Bacillales bacterium]MDY2575496.1 guanylate kinase [Bacilli bacterium]